MMVVMTMMMISLFLVNNYVEDDGANDVDNHMLENDPDGRC